MLDLNILKWNWSQRFILLSYIVTFHLTINKPYAKLTGEFSDRSFKGSHNIMCWLTVIVLLIASSYCFGMYRLKYRNFVFGTLGCIGINLFFLMVSFAKDKRLPTGSYFLSILFVLVTCGLIWYDAMTYMYYDK